LQCAFGPTPAHNKELVILCPLNKQEKFEINKVIKLSHALSSNRFGLIATQQQQHLFNGPFPGQPWRAGTRKVKPSWILLKQEIVSGSGMRWAICNSAPRSRQIITPAPHHSVFYMPDALPAAQPSASKH